MVILLTVLGWRFIMMSMNSSFVFLLSGSLMDYAMPRATHISEMDVSFHEVLDPNNDLGVKGIGEGGACAAPSAVVNAAIDALAPMGITALDMPMTPERLWRAIRAVS